MIFDPMGIKRGWTVGKSAERLVCQIFFVAVFLILFTSTVAAAPVVLVNIKGEIDAGQVALVSRALTEAKQKNAQAVIVEIDTFGGLVDSAVKIRDLVTESPITTICYIKNRAWSAGALIAISHQHIAIAPGGSIGAAEPIPATEKTIAALKAEFAATASKTGRDVKVAEAMVDKSLGFPGYAAPGQILALADYQAVRVGYAETVAADRSAVLNHFGLSAGEVIEYSPTWYERAAAWLEDSTVKSLLLSIIFLAIMTEIKTAGLGAAAFVGLLAAVLFFGGQWLAGFAGWLELALFLAGLLMLIFEIYMPGAGLFGISGVVCILLSFYLALGANLVALNIMAISLVGAVAVFLIILKRLPNSKLWAKLILKDSQTSVAGFVSSGDLSEYVGKEGITLTSLRPAGIVTIDGIQLDVISEGQFVEARTEVKVVNVHGHKVVVRPITN